MNKLDRASDVSGLDGIDLDRRLALGGALGVVGLATLSGCVDGPADGSAESVVAQALSGADIRWVDTVLGASPPAARTGGDLATKTSAQLGATVAIAKGCVTPGDGGGGIFYWQSTSGTDNGGTVIVPNGSLGSTGACWVRVYAGGLSVRYFGAVGNGTNDDYTAIANAVAYAGSSGGRTVFFPVGIYKISSSIALSQPGVCLVGETTRGSIIQKSGANSTSVVVSVASSPGDLCEISNLTLSSTNGGSAPTSGAAILFNTPATYGTRISKLLISGTYGGIWCQSTSFNGTVGGVWDVLVEDIEMGGIVLCGIYLEYATNWHFSNITIYMADTISGHYGVWLDTESEGCYFYAVAAQLGEHCWRFAKTRANDAGGHAPNSHRFIACVGDSGRVTCYYASALWRSYFDNCYASTQSASCVAAFVVDSTNVYELQWINGEMINNSTHAFQFLSVGSFNISNSVFATWGKQGNGYNAIQVYPCSTASFVITANTFLTDQEFPTSSVGTPIVIGCGTFYKYVVTGNVWAGVSGLALNDGGSATSGKVTSGNL
jgi:hypothetical protein